VDGVRANRSFAYWIAVALVKRRTHPSRPVLRRLELSTPTRPSCDKMLTIDRHRASMTGITATGPRNTPVQLIQERFHASM